MGHRKRHRRRRDSIFIYPLSQEQMEDLKSNLISGRYLLVYCIPTEEDFEKSVDSPFWTIEIKEYEEDDDVIFIITDSYPYMLSKRNGTFRWNTYYSCGTRKITKIEIKCL